MRHSTHLFKHILITLSVLLTTTSLLFAQCKQEGSSVVCRDARFQFLTPTSVRMEFAPGSAFADPPSVVVQKRTWKQVPIEVWADKQWMVAKTSKMILRYKVNSGRFTKDNLEITMMEGSRRTKWTFADSDRVNLGGISYSLDGLRKERMPKVEPGLLSRKGYSVFDDSGTPIWDTTGNWIEPRRKGGQDLYFFWYGNDYEQMLEWYAQLCGPIPMIPRYTLGAWITDLNYEYLPGSDMVDKYQYTEKDVKGLVERFRKEQIPLDVLVLDYAWHKFGWKGGYDWSPIFPQPKEFLDWAHTNGLKISLNDHPGYGAEGVLSNDDSHAEAIRTALRIPPPEEPTLKIELSPTWKFKTDPSDVGVKEKWFAPETKDDSWASVQSGRPWEDQGFKGYDGVAWYRQSIKVAVNVPPVSLYLTFGGVDDEYDVYVNGNLAGHQGSPGNTVYNTLTFTNINRWLLRGEENVIALRVNDWGGGGGIVAPPFVIVNKPPPTPIRFNLANKQQAQAFMDILHNPLIDQGVDFWWVDGGRGAADMPGLDAQLWTNRIYYDFTEQHTKKRGFIFSRYGGWGSHRYPSYFTGDTYSQWQVLAYEVPYTARGGNVLMPYITHDIGGFIGPNISFDLYARWIQFGVFSPFLRLHSAHENPQEGNVRMPWTFGQKGVDFARSMFRLRYSLLPYIYTYTRIAYDRALPLLRPLYLENQSLGKAYNYPNEYYFGEEFLVSPVLDSAGVKETYLPPGTWYDYFTGKKYTGDRAVRETYPLDRMPVFVKSGSVIPMQKDLAYSNEKPLDALIIDVYGPDKGSFDLYEDDGTSLDYQSGKDAWTPIAWSKAGGNAYELTVGPTKGEFAGQPQSRSYEVRVHGITKPGSVSINNRKARMGGDGEGWTWDAGKSILTIRIDANGIRESVKVAVE